MPINNEISIRGGYQPFGIRRDNHLDIFSSSLDKITQQHEKAIETQSAISKALADIELNEAEDEWKTNYINQIKDEINSLASFGNYSGALTRATLLAGRVTSDPALRGRIRAQKEYKNFVDNTLARRDLTEDDKSWALAMNPYKYEDKVDNNGNIVGGTDWKPTTRPVGEIDYNKLLATAKQMVFQESGGATQVVFYDAEGRDTTNPLTAEGVKYYKNGTWQGISKKKLTELVEAAIDNEPGARARIDQDWQVANWKYNQLSEEEKENNKPSELFASNGRKYTKQEWYNNKFGRAINAMSGMNYTSSIKYDDDYTKFMAARRAGVGNAANDPFGGQLNLITGKGNPAELETEDIVNKAFGKVSSGIQDLEKVLPNYLKNTTRWKEARKNGDFDTLGRLAKVYLDTQDVENKPALQAKLREFRDNASLINSIKKNKGDYEAIAFNGAFTTGGELPADNRYTKEFMKRYNAFGGNNAVALRYSFADGKTMSDFIETAGLTNADYQITNTEDGLPALIINKSNTKNYKALELYDDLGYQGEQTSVIDDIKQNGFWRGISRFRRTGINGVNENGGIIRSSKPWQGSNVSTSSIFAGGITLGLNDVTSDAASGAGIIDIAKAARIKAKQSVGDMAVNKVIVTTKNLELPGVMQARVQYADDPSKQSSAATLAVDEAVNTIMGLHGSQYEIMMSNDESGLLRKTLIKDRTAALEDIQSYLTNNRSSAKDLIGIKVVDGKIGYRIRIPKTWNESKNSYVDGDINPNEIVIFAPDDPLLQKMERDTRFIATNRLEKLERVNNASHFTFDKNELKLKQGIPFINGRRVDRETAISLLDVDEGYNQLKDTFSHNITNSWLVGLARFIEQNYGYRIGSNANADKAAELINQMQNELR